MQRLASSSKSAFTLVEIILGITVLTIVLVAITVLTLTSIRANGANIHRLTAYYLAQEGVEGVRNMRDSNWMQNHVWNEGAKFWGTDFNKEGYYVLNYLESPGLDGVPWTLRFFDSEDSARAVGEVRDGYTRYIHVTFPDINNEDLMEVTAIVEWQNYAGLAVTEVSTQLTDWREGPL
jgi:hypothetical protein